MSDAVHFVSTFLSTKMLTIPRFCGIIIMSYKSFLNSGLYAVQRQGGRANAPPVYYYTTFSRICQHLQRFFSKFFYRYPVSFCRPPRVGPASARTRAPKRRTAAPKDGEGPAGRTERWEGRGPAGPDTRAANKPARPPANRVGGGRRLPRGGGRGEQTPTKPGPAHTDVADVSIVSSGPAPGARKQATKRGHKRAKTGKTGNAAKQEQSGTGRRPQTPPGGAPHGRWAREPSDD